MHLTRRSVILGMLGTALNPAQASAGVQVEGGFAFGSSWRITTDEATDLAAVRSMIEAVITEVDSQMSPYRAASHLSVFNTARTLDWQSMPAAFCEVAARALRVADLTGGAFDPTVGPVVSRFGFGPISGGAGRYSGIEVGEGALRKDMLDLTLDLCGIAKGYALDRIVAALSNAGVDNALVEVGGEVRAMGRHPDGRAWQVAIVDPLADGFRVHRIITPGKYALATSGHAANGIAGKLCTSHIIDPRRSQPASTLLASVSVLASEASHADALATALCAVGPDAGVILARHLDISALFIVKGGSGLTDIMTGHFAQHVLI